MPFEPLTPEEAREYPEPCRSAEHDPPSHIVITHPIKWVCPSCGASMILRPPTVRMVVEPDLIRRRRVDALPACHPAQRSQSLKDFDAMNNNGCSICRDPNCDNPGGKH